MKKHNTSKVVLVTMLIFLLLTWILPAAYYSGEFVDQGRVQMGLFDLFNYPLTALSYFGYIGFFFVLVGGFYGILYKIPAYRTFLDKIAEKARGKEKIVLSIIIIVNAFFVSICGMQFALALFVPFIVSIILLMGYDKVVAAFVTVGSIVAGLIGSTYAYSNLSILTSALDLKLDYQIGVRFVILIVAIVLVIFNTLMYIKKNMADVKIEKKTIRKVEEEIELEEKEEKVEVHKTTPKKSTTSKAKTTSKKSTKSSKSRRSDNKAALKDEDIIVVREGMEKGDYVPHSVNGKHKTWPFVLVFCLLFILLVLAFITWGDNGFGVKLFDDVTTNIQDFELFKFPLFAKILGTVNSFGNWSLTDLFLPMALATLLLILIYKVSFKEAYQGFVAGAKKALGPAALVILVYSILVLVTYHPFQLVIYKAILGMSKGFNIATTTIVAVLAGLFNADMVYSFQSVVPYFASQVTKHYDIAAIIFQSMYGLTMLVAPTSLVLLATLSYLDISYKEWFKKIWTLLLELFVVLLIIFIILALV